MAAKISNWLGTRSHRSHLSGALVVKLAVAKSDIFDTVLKLAVPKSDSSDTVVNFSSVEPASETVPVISDLAKA